MSVMTMAEAARWRPLTAARRWISPFPQAERRQEQTAAGGASLRGGLGRSSNNYTGIPPAVRRRFAASTTDRAPDVPRFDVFLLTCGNRHSSGTCQYLGISVTWSLVAST